MLRTLTTTATLCALLITTACEESAGDAPTATTTDSATAVASAASTSTPDAGGIIRTPAALLPAGAAGRDDCPADWLVVVGAPVSVCVPLDHHAEFVSLPPDGKRWLEVRLIGGAPVAATPSLLGLGTMETYQAPTTCEFEAEQIDASAQTELAPYVVGGVNGVACTARTSYAVRFKGSAPTKPKALEFRAYAVNDAELELSRQILSTVRVR